jgi:hypothetical protein
MLPTGPASMPRLQQDTAPSSLSCVLGVVKPVVELSPLARAHPSRTDIADPRVRLDWLVARFVAGVWDNPMTVHTGHHVQRPQRDGSETAAISAPAWCPMVDRRAPESWNLWAASRQRVLDVSVVVNSVAASSPLRTGLPAVALESMDGSMRMAIQLYLATRSAIPKAKIRSRLHGLL